jgi:DNA-binding FadR family transcriptional regulator
MPTLTAGRRPAKAIFQPVTGPRPATEIIQQIRDLIHAQQLQADSRLPSERDLAEQFGVSRNSVRQALRSLEEQGLLVIRKGATGGAFIQRGGASTVPTLLSDLFSLGAIQPQDLTEVRVMVGVEVVRLACERGTDDDIDLLEGNVRAAEEAVKAGDLALRTGLNLRFHNMLAGMTRNALLIAITDGVVTVTGQFVSRIGRTPTSHVMPFRRRLLKHLRARETDAAIAEMRRHLLQQQKLYLKAAAILNMSSSSK